jgi:hypothetical protein
MEKFNELVIDVIAESVMDAISLFEESVEETSIYSAILEESNKQPIEFLEALLSEEAEEKSEVVEEGAEVKEEGSEKKEEEVVEESASFEDALDKLLSEFASEE